MEQKINIAELLKDCPSGMELDCTLYDNCTFEGIEDIGYINILVKTPNGQIKLSKEGCIIHNCNSAKCVIFPKGKTTWEGFVPPYKFKVGDKVVKKGGVSIPVLITRVGDEFYYSNTENSVGFFRIKEQDDWELVLNKFNINTLVPFESRILVRNYDSDYWKPAIFGFSGKDKNAPFCVEGGNFFNKCIPYEGNEHLLGTRNDCDDFYKTWE